MFKNLSTLTLLLLSVLAFSQIKGKVSDTKGNPLPYVNIFIENTYIGTTTNENGSYELNYNIKGTTVILFQYLGYKTQKQVLSINAFPYSFDVILEDENFELNEVVLTNGENPANEIIRKAIANKSKNTERTDKFEADFYS